MAANRLERARTWWSTTTWGSARWQRILTAALAAFVIAPQASVDAGVGLDPSWEAAVALAPGQHITWGRALVFTYGPLGYLQTTAYYSFFQSIVATIFQLVVVTMLFLGIAAALRQRYRPTPSLLCAFGATALVAILQAGHGTSLGMTYPELGVLAVLAWVIVPTLQHDPDLAAVFRLCVLTGAFAGLLLLIKFNTGLTALLLGLVASCVLGWRALGRHCATVTAFVVSAIIWWTLAGQRLGDMLSWLRYSRDIVSGYNESQAIPLSSDAGPAILLTLVWLAAIIINFIRGGNDLSRRSLTLISVLSVITVKSAFGRFDIWHLSILLGVIVVGVTIMPAVRTQFRVALILAVALVFASVSGVPALQDRTLTAVRMPMQNIDRLVTLAVPDQFQRRVDRAKERQRDLYAVPHRFLKIISSKTVHVDPYETSVIWAYNLAWRPAPVFATYSAYTPALDKLNGEALASSPDFVLQRISATSPASGIDNRLSTQESPLYYRALLCNYTVSGVENGWALFTRAKQRCGPLVPLAEVDLPQKAPVAVPTPQEADLAILVGIDVDRSIADELFQGTIVPLTTFSIVINDGAYRLITPNLKEPFLIVSPSAVNGTNLAIDAHKIDVVRARPLGQTGVHARLRFYSMRVSPVDATS
ncbi:hypothetical protein [Mycobacterium sp. 23]|uniref:hypothetical protein n=1 Tax=Mycobacterium sp. 23 TaxID=3400424 RepID=UPI003AACBBD3